MDTQFSWGSFFESVTASEILFQLLPLHCSYSSHHSGKPMAGNLRKCRYRLTQLVYFHLDPLSLLTVLRLYPSTAPNLCEKKSSLQKWISDKWENMARCHINDKLLCRFLGSCRDRDESFVMYHLVFIFLIHFYHILIWLPALFKAYSFKWTRIC